MDARLEAKLGFDKVREAIQVNSRLLKIMKNYSKTIRNASY